MKLLHGLAKWLTYVNVGAAIIGCLYVAWLETGWIGLLVVVVAGSFLFYQMIFLIPALALFIPPHVWWLAVMVYGGMCFVNGLKKLYLYLMFKKYGPSTEAS
jgi:hypothetical protein